MNGEVRGWGVRGDGAEMDGKVDEGADEYML